MFALFVAQVYGHFITLLGTSPVGSQIVQQISCEQNPRLPDQASLRVILLVHRGNSLASGNRASISVEHCRSIICLFV